MSVKALLPSNFGGRLFLIFLAVMAVPLSLIFLVLVTGFTASQQEDSFAQLRFVRDAKQAEIEQYFAFSLRQAETLVRSSAMRYSVGDFYGFSYAFRMIDPVPENARRVLQDVFALDQGDIGQPAEMGRPLVRKAFEYANAHNRFHEDFLSFLRGSGFDNLYLINTAGLVVYSVEKDGYLGSDVGAAQQGTPLGHLARTMLGEPGAERLVRLDFGRDPVTQAFAAYIAIRIEFHNRTRGLAVFRLPAGAVDRLVQGQFGNRAVGQLFLTGSNGALISAPPDGALRSGDRRAAPVPPSSEQGTDILDKGSAGEAALSAWTVLPFGDRLWYLSAEMPTGEAFAKTEALTRFVVGVAAITLPVIVLVAFVLSRAISASLGRLTDAAEAIAAGRLELDMPDISRPDELVRLTASFRRMRMAARDQLALIGQKNRELEQARILTGKPAEEATEPMEIGFATDAGLDERDPGAPDLAASPDRGLYRETVVAVMTDSLQLWRKATGKSKFDLAEESGIWRVSLDRSSLQARTLDKYLLLDTLPERPRWRDVISTGEFVLARAAAQEPAMAEALSAHLEGLRRLVKASLDPVRA